MNLFEFSHASDNNATHGTRTLQEHWLCVALADKWVYSHHQTWKCPLLVVVGVFLGLSFVPMKFPLRGARVKGKGTEIWKKKSLPL